MPFANEIYCSTFEDGPLSRPPVVLLHGEGGDRLCWPADIRRLPGERVIAVDLPGHGRSESIALQSIEEYGKSILDFLAGMGIYQINLVGHSMGGAIALWLAVHHPERVIRLAVISGSAAFNIDQRMLTALSNPSSFKEGLDILKTKLFGPQAGSHLRQLVNNKLLALRQGVLYGDCLACAKFEIGDLVHKIKVPTLVIAGDHDQFTPPYQSRHLADRIKNSTLQFVSKAGHMLILESPSIIRHGLVNFFKDQ